MSTICACATAAGSAGVAVIRISGSSSLEILKKIFVGTDSFEPRHMYYGSLTDGRDVIDNVLAVYFPAPNSYTGEDVAEIHCHGGHFPIKNALSLAVAAGARMAEPGEFTKRAFVNGKLDLTEAEAIMEYIGAASAAGARVSQRKLSGELKHKIESAQDELLDIMAEIEAGVEYPEEDIRIAGELSPRLTALSNKISALADTYSTGRTVKEGLRIAICGTPNVGKSSLLNRIIGEERAIVTHIPGTTRDVVTEYFDLRGIPVQFMDTAGIRDAEDVVEKIGVERSKNAVDDCDIALFVMDSSRDMTDEEKEIFNSIPENKRITVINKIDLAPLNFKEKCIAVSAKTGEGMDALLDEIYARAEIDAAALEGVCITSERHMSALRNAASSLLDAVDVLELGAELDCASIDLRDAFESLGELTGSSVSEDIINKIFEKFCLGK